MLENWNLYKDLEFYPDRVCACGCGGRIKINVWHYWEGRIPEYIRGHHTKTEKFRDYLKNREVWWKDKIGLSRKGKTYEEFFGDAAEEEIQKRIKNSVFYDLEWQKEKGLLNSGKNNNFYKDGSWINSKGPDYHANFTEEFRESIRDRDDHTCQVCKLTEKQLCKTLSVHHIHYDPMNDCSNNVDFVSLCNSCHPVTNSNREYWESYFAVNKLVVC